MTSGLVLGRSRVSNLAGVSSASRDEEEIEICFLGSTPVTVVGGELVPCPLARLRDVGQEGPHYHHNGSTKRSVYISEYITADYPCQPGNMRSSGSRPAVSITDTI